MLRQFYSREMLPFSIFLWVQAVIYLFLAIFSAVRFFRVEDTRGQIMYAVIFLTAMQLIVLVKIFAWQLINRNNIKRAIYRLEERIEQLKA